MNPTCDQEHDGYLPDTLFILLKPPSSLELGQCSYNQQCVIYKYVISTFYCSHIKLQHKYNYLQHPMSITCMQLKISNSYRNNHKSILPSITLTVGEDNLSITRQFSDCFQILQHTYSFIANGYQKIRNMILCTQIRTLYGNSFPVCTSQDV